MFLTGLPLVLAGCATQSVWAPDDVVARAIYRDPSDSYLTLYTMRNVGSDNGAHTALLINASQRVMFDPAGSFRQNVVPERNDVLFGVTPRFEELYVSYHARVTYYVVGQKVSVTPEVAEQALNLALTNGAVMQSFCANATSTLLQQLPGFGHVRRSFSPNRVMEDFGKVAGVETRTYYENDEDDKSIAAQRIAELVKAGQ